MKKGVTCAKEGGYMVYSGYEYLGLWLKINQKRGISSIDIMNTGLG